MSISKKTLIIINGKGGVGKDTLCEIAARHFRVKNVSSITPIKEIAAEAGWKGEKTDKARKFLADLKQLMIEYNDYPTEWCLARYREFLLSDDEIMFVHVREPEEIAKLVGKTEGAAKTLLIRSGERLKRAEYGNAADDCVENYDYDFYFVNDKPLDEAEPLLVALIREIVG